MTREEFRMIAAGLRETYRRDKLLDTKEAFDVWYELLKDLDYRTAAQAAQAYMMTEHFPPVPADIRKKAAELADDGSDMTEAEAWALVMRALSNGNYGYQEEFDRLPADIQRAVGSAMQIHIWAGDENFNESMERSHFVRTYRTIRERNKQKALLPQQMRDDVIYLEDFTAAQIEEIKKLRANAMRRGMLLEDREEAEG